MKLFRQTPGVWGSAIKSSSTGTQSETTGTQGLQLSYISFFIWQKLKVQVIISYAKEKENVGKQNNSLIYWLKSKSIKKVVNVSFVKICFF